MQSLDTRGPADYEFANEEILECPYPFYAALRREAPVYRLPGDDVFFVSRWEDIVYVAEHPELFSATRQPEASAVARLAVPPQECPAHAVSPIGLSNCDGAEHRLKRSIALRLVAPARLRAYEPYIAQAVDALIDDFAARGEVEFVSAFSTPLPVQVICEMLGVPREDELFGRMMRQVPASAVRFISDEAKEVRRQVGGEIYAFMSREVIDRYERPREDFLSEFVREHVELAGSLPLEYVVTEATTLLFGGLVTTQHMFTNTMCLLIEHPEQLERIRRDPSLIRPMLEESLRIESPFHMTELTCLADTELAGVPIPAGAAVYKIWGSGNRDHERFQDADDFRPGRPGLAKQHLGFGRGNHRCLGAPLALLEGTFAFERLLARLTNLRFADGKNDWAHVHAVSFRSLERLYLQFDPA